MKVFISWSGDLSHKVAMCLRDWIPNVIQTINPYVSSEDIDKGARWSQDIAGELNDSFYGILCVTASNINAPWLNFEAGALSKSMDNANVSPLLINLKRSDVKGPILQFQSTIFEREDFRKLVLSLNRSDKESRLEDSRLSNIFDKWWPNLEEELKPLVSNDTDSDSTKTPRQRQAARQKTRKCLRKYSRFRDKIQDQLQ